VEYVLHSRTLTTSCKWTDHLLRPYIASPTLQILPAVLRRPSDYKLGGIWGSGWIGLGMDLNSLGVKGCVRQTESRAEGRESGYIKASTSAVEQESFHQPQQPPLNDYYYLSTYTLISVHLDHTS